MKVAIDISNLNALNKTRGVGSYTKNLFEALKKYTNMDVRLVDETSSERFDLVHYPYFDLFEPTLKIGTVPTVVTVHDVIPLLFPKAYPPGIRGSIKNFRQRLVLKKARAIITDSKASKKDIEKYLGIDPSRIHVVYLAAADDFKKINDQNLLKRIKAKYNLPEKFVLYTGSTNWNKNLINLTEAAISDGVDIVFAGKGFEEKNNLDHPELRSYSEFLEKFSKNPLVHILGFVEGGDIVPIFNLAQIVMLVSIYEGFGLTILEAQQSGTAVIASNTSSMPEVAGEGAVLVDPERPEKIAEAITKILENKTFRDDLIKKGFENAKNFTWQKAADQTVKVYEQVLGEK